MKKELFLATTLALAGCTSPKPSETPEPPAADSRLVELVDCRKGPFSDEKSFAVSEEYVIFAARRASDYRQIRIRITPESDRRFGLMPENDKITGLISPRDGLVQFNTSGVSWEIDGVHDQAGKFHLAASAKCTEVKPVEP